MPLHGSKNTSDKFAEVKAKNIVAINKNDRNPITQLLDKKQGFEGIMNAMARSEKEIESI